LKNIFKNIGPGTLVAAAFIGPGTITACTISGVKFGQALLWAMVLSIIATIVLQEMAARLGIITQKGLADVIKEQIKSSFFRKIAIALILGAIVIGNAAYEAGNIGGASLGLEAVFGIQDWDFYPLLIGIIAFILLFIGNYKFLERSLIVLVLIMSSSFLLTAIITKPNISEVVTGMLLPKFPKGSLLTIIALVGTTVVPYNLFLHASIVQERWKTKDGLSAARKDTLVSIILGGIVSMAIIVSAASIQSAEVANVLDLAKGLEPLYGNGAKYFLGIGLFAAGITSSITAPLAAAYVANSCFGWKASIKDNRFRLVWIMILFLGVLSLSFDVKPIEVIQFAQIANGILLPVIAGFLLWVVNKSEVLGIYKNSKLQNAIGIVIVLITLLLGTRGILKVFGLL